MKQSEAERRAKSYYAKTANNKAGCPERIAEAHKCIVWVRESGYAEVEPTTKVLGTGKYGTFNVAGFTGDRMVPYLRYGNEFHPLSSDFMDFRGFRDAGCWGFWQRFEKKPKK